MFRLRTAHDHVHTLERVAHSGMYIVHVRSGITTVAKLWFDTGRDAWRAYRLSAERLMTEYQ